MNVQRKAFTKPFTPSDELAEIVGAAPISQVEVTKRLWAYIKQNELQDADERTMINADEKLQRVFGRSRASMFQMLQLVKTHLSVDGRPLLVQKELPGEIPTPKKPKSPDWARDELILALALYLTHRGKALDESHPKVVELSVFLNRMGAVLGVRVGTAFRNPVGVAMKLMNFRRLDPDAKVGTFGLRNGNRLEEPVWRQFASAPEELARVVASIRATVDAYEASPALAGEDELDVEEAPEGRLLTRLHRVRERSRKLVEACKSRALRRHGRLFCEGCGFDFVEKYGVGCDGIIDCHHAKPVSSLGDDATTRVSDLVLLCANCHRVVHSSRPWLTVEQLKARVHAARLSAPVKRNEP